MPIKESAKKAMRQSITRRARNMKRKKAVKEVIKKTTKVAELSKAQSVIDKVAKSGYIHKNKAARLKSRLAKRVSAKS